MSVYAAEGIEADCAKGFGQIDICHFYSFLSAPHGKKRGQKLVYSERSELFLKRKFLSGSKESSTAGAIRLITP